MKPSIINALLAAALAATPVSILAAEPTGKAPDITIEQIFKRAQYGGGALSPKGDKLAVLTPVNDRLALAIINLETRQAKVAASSKDWDVVSPRWINNDRLLFSVSDTKVVMEKNAGGGLFAINSDGSGFKVLSKTVKQARADGDSYRPKQFIRNVDKEGTDVLVAFDERSSDNEDSFGSSDVYRLDTKSGRTKLLTFDNPGQITDWVVDNNNQVRVGISLMGDKAAGRLKYRIFYRDNNDAKWRVLSEFFMDDEGYVPIGFDADNKTMYVTGRNKEDTDGLYTWDFEKNQPKELLFRHERADFRGTLLRDYETDRVVGLSIDAMKTENYFFDDEYAGLYATFEATFKDMDVGMQKRGDRVMVFAGSSTDPGQLYMYDTKKKQMEKLFAYNPAIDPAKMSEMQVTSYVARDGLEIPAYLTLPKHKEAKKLPLVAYIHGGPHARDSWGFDPMTQTLASRGYAVLQPQFRMSTGLGWKLFRSGWKQWGLSMQDDVTDGVNHLVKQGIVDPNRVCIIGASYGGYATMYGLVKDPDFYKCGVNWVGVTDISMLFNVSWSDTNDGPWSKYRAKDMHGDPEKDRDYMKKSSALENAERIKAPVLMAYGSEDIRVPLIHGEKMRDKLLKKGNVVEWMVFVGEGHGWAKEENNVKFGKAVADFLDRYIGDAANKSVSK